MGYHVKHIRKGSYGEVSKVYEEVQELDDALDQDNRVMGLVEMADILSAINGILRNHYNSEITLEDLVKMSRATDSAFADGSRK